MKDFSSKQPKPENGNATTFEDNDDAFVPTTGFTEAPRTPNETGNFGPGPGTPANRRVIH